MAQKESSVAQQTLRDETCLVSSAGLYADITVTCTEEHFLLQPRQKSKETKNANHDDSDCAAVFLI